MNKDIKGICVGVFLMVIMGILLGSSFYLVDKIMVEPQFKKSLSQVKDLVDKQITTNMTFEQKLNIVKNSCEFIFGDFASQCNKELLNQYTQPQNIIYISR